MLCDCCHLHGSSGFVQVMAISLPLHPLFNFEFTWTHLRCLWLQGQAKLSILPLFFHVCDVVAFCSFRCHFLVLRPVIKNVDMRQRKFR